MDNLFDSLCSGLNEPSIKSLFLSAEGPDLMVLMMKWVRNFIMNDLSLNAMKGETTIQVPFYQSIGLRDVWSGGITGMREFHRSPWSQNTVLSADGKGQRQDLHQLNIRPYSIHLKKKKSSAGPPASEETTHILGVISSLFSNLASDSASRIRLLAKFVESNYEKVDKLLEIRDTAQARLKVTEVQIEAEQRVSQVSYTLPLF